MTRARSSGGSRPRKRRNVDRDSIEGHDKIVRDYFVDLLVYPAPLFKRHIWIQHSLFLRVMQAVCEFDPYFVQKRNAAGFLSLSSIQKCTVELCILAYNVGGDATDKYCRLASSIAIEAMKRFVAII